MRDLVRTAPASAVVAAVLCLSAPPLAAGPEALPDSLVPRARTDTVYTLAPIVVRAPRIHPQEVLDRLPGQASAVEMATERDRLTTTAAVLDRVPGLHVSDYGSLGAFSTVSIRGAGASQVSVYLDGIPLSRAGLGVVNLADLPFAALDRLEVYRSFAPAEFPGAQMGGAINLVTRAARPGGQPSRRSALLLGGGSFGTRRAGLSHELVGGGWSGLAVLDHTESVGDFAFQDDNGTPLEPTDDEVVLRRNNWVRADEILLRLGRALPHGELHILDQWVRREHGVPGISSFQSQRARGGATWNLTSAEARFPALAGGRVGLTGRLFHEWRRDTFSDPASEIGLGYQDNRDETRTLGTHAGVRLRLPVLQQLVLDVESRHESFVPTRRFPTPTRGPEQERTSLEAAIEERLVLATRLGLHAGLRATRRVDRFAGDLRTPYSQRPARSGTDDTLEPRLGVRVQIWRGLALQGSWGRYHRPPGFLELFGDGGSVAGSSDLVAEEGTNRDIGLVASGKTATIEARAAVAHFDNRVEHLITFLPQSQRTFVARNIGAASMRGQEWSWQIGAAGDAPRWHLDGNFTHLETRDLGVDIRWYAGKTLPGRPATQFWQRLAVRLGPLDLGYEYDHIGRNYLDRWNRDVVARRDLHAVDVRIGRRGLGLQMGLQNLTDERAADVAGFPLPGRTFFLTTSYKL